MLVLMNCQELTAGVDLALEARMFSLLPGEDLGVSGRPLGPLGLVAEDNVAQQDENYRYPGHLVQLGWRTGAPAKFIFQHIWTSWLRSEPTPQK